MKTEISDNRTFLMGLAMFAIILFHHNWTIIPIITGIFSRFGLWGVDIFFFLSGFGCVYALKKYNLSVFYKKRSLRLFPTCLLIGIIILCFDCYFNAEHTHAHFLLKIISLHRWYIQAILICYLLCPFWYKIIRKYKLWGCIILAVITIIIEQYIPNHGVYKIKWALERYPTYIITTLILCVAVKFSINCITHKFISLIKNRKLEESY